MSALTCIGIGLFLYMPFCSFAIAFTFGDEHGKIEKSPEVENVKLMTSLIKPCNRYDEARSRCLQDNFQ